MEKHPAVHILASRRNGTLYIGVTSNLLARAQQHRRGLVSGFTRQYHVKLLVYYEVHETMYAAITREKRMKKWRRAWKVEVIEEKNLFWKDLWEQVIGAGNQAATRRPGFPLARE